MSAQQIAAAAAPDVARKRTQRGGPLKVWIWLPPLLVLGLLIGLWYAVHFWFVLGLGRNGVVPMPHDVIAMFGVDSVRDDLFSALWTDVVGSLVGLAIASAIGIVWAILMNTAKWLERSTYPYAVVLQSVPILALAPLISVVVQDGFWSRIVVCVLIALFPMVSNTFFGLRSVDRAHRELFRLQGASWWTRLTKLDLPTARPAIFAGLRISAGLSVVGAIVGDFFFQQGGSKGLGTLLRLYQSRNQIEPMFAAVILASLLGVLVFLLFGLVARLVVGKWYDFG